MSYCCEEYGNTLVIVPNKGLVTQTEEDFKNLGLDVGVYFGDRKELGHKHTICTWQILNILQKKSKKHSYEDKKKLELILDDLTAVIVDEVHQAKSKVLQDLLGGILAHVPIRWGLTGTVPKEEHSKTIIECVIGPVVNTISPKELQEAGILANCHIDILQLKDKFNFSNFHDESSALAEDLDRLKWIANFAKTTAEEGNTLILVNKIKTGEILNEFIEDSVFISGKMKVNNRKEHYDDVHGSEGKIIIATYGVAAVGINIPRIFNLVLFEPGKSFVRVIQSIGRSLRLAKDKDFARIFDIASTCKYSKRHLTERKKYYKEKEYPFTIQKIDWNTE